MHTPLPKPRDTEHRLQDHPEVNEGKTLDVTTTCPAFPLFWLGSPGSYELKGQLLDVWGSA